ncbi:hypothetical protein ILYODFUR_035624 [Ilyodon furcidens]|uniref:Uncharacterized protein n=1 Tax=Ilyodon furcidens TaxID=33524 RepID=A0ABV0ULR1_9TELE
MEVSQGTEIQPGRKGKWTTGGLGGSRNKQGTENISNKQMQKRETIQGKTLEGFRQGKSSNPETESETGRFQQREVRTFPNSRRTRQKSVVKKQAGSDNQKKLS